jgi:hypothetical protein
MLDVQFTDTIASALRCAMKSTPKENGESLGDEDVSRICRRAAWQLMFDLDGQSLLDLAMAKLSAEQDLALDKAA